jgi:RNA polymerase sigma-70 factor (ECF subfamily)
MLAPAAESNEGPVNVEALWRTHHRRIRAHLRQIVPAADVEDVLQEAFLSAWQATDRLDPARDPGPWLTTIARNRAIDRLRRRSVRPVSLADDEAIARLPAGDPTDPAEQLERMRGGRAIEALRQLPELQRRYVVLHHLDGFSLAEIAHGDGTSIDSVKAHLYRARRSLGAALNHLIVWPGLLLGRLRRLVDARTDPAIVIGANTLAVTALTGLLATLPTPSSPKSANVETVRPVAETTQLIDETPGVLRLGRMLAGDGASSSLVGAPEDRPPSRHWVAAVDAELPNPASGGEEKHRFWIWLEDDGNDSVITSSIETANDVACDTAANSCPRPIDWFKG